MNQSLRSCLSILCLLALSGCGGEETGGSHGGGGAPTGVAMQRVGTYQLDRDAFLQTYVEGKAGAWPDLAPEKREREHERLVNAARLGFESLAASLELVQDGTFLFSRRMAGVPTVHAGGTWRESAEGVQLEVTHEGGRRSRQPRTIVARQDAGALHLLWSDGELPAFVMRRAPGH